MRWGYGGARRWAAVLAGILLLSSLPTLVRLVPVRADPDRAATPRDLLARSVAAAGIPHEGLAEARGRLGLPEVPQLQNGLDLLRTTTRSRVWWESDQRWRLAVVGAATETNTYRNGDTTTTYDSQRDVARTNLGDRPVRLPAAEDLVPPAVTRRLLQNTTMQDILSGLPARRVGGRAAYGLRVTPADPRTTIAAVDLWADRVSGLPLRVEVQARGSKRPGFTAEFLSVSLRRPSETDLALRVPLTAGFVSEEDPDVLARFDREAPWSLPDRLAGLPRVDRETRRHGSAVYGSGLTRLVVLPISPRRLRRVLNQAEDAPGTTSVSYAGGTALLATTPLVIAALAGDDDGPHAYLAAGTVTAALMEDALTELFADEPPPR